MAGGGRLLLGRFSFCIMLVRSTRHTGSWAVQGREKIEEDV